MGREVGGGFRMRNTCKSVADSCQCMAETIHWRVAYWEKIFAKDISDKGL